MQWVESERTAPPRLAAAARLAQEAMRLRPDSGPARAAAAAIAFRRRDFAAAIAGFESLASHRGGAAPDWAMLSESYLRVGDPGAALAACDRGRAAGCDGAALAICRGKALAALGRPGEARAAFVDAIDRGDDRFRGLFNLLAPLARLADGGPLLAACDALPSLLAHGTVARANRAIALSRLGREDEARALVDLDRHIVQVPIAEQASDGDAAAFNAQLAAEALALAGSGVADAETRIVYDPDTRAAPAMTRLLDRVRAAMEAYLAEAPALGLDQCLPPPPARARLFCGVTVLRGAGHNGLHIHPFGHVSSVYHVNCPDTVARAADGRGALSIGACAAYTGGYAPCWGERRLAPRPGWLTLFPSHFFHDVIPSRDRAARISIPVDLEPVA